MLARLDTLLSRHWWLRWALAALLCWLLSLGVRPPAAAPTAAPDTYFDL